MTITQTRLALGDWSLRLRPETPREILDQLGYFGHIAVLPGRLDIAQYGDNLLSAARYVGVYTGRSAQDEYDLGGQGMALWLGDSDGKGDVIETPKAYSNETFANTIRDLLPESGAVTEGTIHSVAGTYSGTHQWQTPREAITYVCGIYSTDTNPVEWRVNNDGTLDAGLVSDLYRTVPTTLLVRQGLGGRELSQVAIPGRMQLQADTEDYSTRVVVLAEGEGGSIATGDADALAVPYLDLHGNEVKLTRLVSSAETTGGNADAVAQLQLNRFTNPRYQVNLQADAYDITGDLVMGDYLAIFDPANGFADPSNEQIWRGQPINPIYLRCIELTWPIQAGWTVAYRSGTGAWVDLSQWYIPEAGQTTIKVGDVSSAMTGIGSQPIGTRPIGDSSIPAAPTFTGFSQGNYQSAPESGSHQSMTKAALRVQWSLPLNLDGSTILDGDHYEIRHRINSVIGYSVDWDTLAAFSWDDLGTWDALISEPVTADPQWQTSFVAWGTNAFTIAELTPGVQYELQISAVDSASPPNRGPFSASSFVTTIGDLLAPSTPAAAGPVAGNPLAVQITHMLGKASGGTFNLEQDLDHLEVHLGGAPDFLPDETTRLGEMIATAGMMSVSTPAVGTFTIPQVSAVYIKVIAVDVSGNRSSASAAAVVTATLIDDQYIWNLSVSKLTAGTISASGISVGNEITVGTGGVISTLQGQFQVRDPTYLNPPILMGLVGGSYQLRMQDLYGNAKVILGQVDPTGGYGTENYDLMMVDPDTGLMVSANTLAFGMEALEAQTSLNVTATTFIQATDGNGPQLYGIRIGPSRRAMVIVGADINYTPPGTDNRTAWMSYHVIREDTGVEVVGTGDNRAVTLNTSGAQVGNVGYSRATFLGPDQLPAAGLYTFETMYKVNTGNPMTFQNRTLIVMPF